MSRSRKNKSFLRFTLVELIAAMSVMTFVSLIIATAAVTYYRSWKTGAELTAQIQDYQKIDTIMDTLVRNLIPFRWTDEENDTGSDLVFSGETDRIHFAALRRSYAGDAGALLFVRLRLDGSNLIAEYAHTPRFPWVNEDEETLPWQREVLTSKVRSLRFQYADKTTSGTIEWVDEDWDNEERPMPPLAVRMTIEWEDGHTESWLRRTAGSGANSVFGEREEVTADAASAN